MDKGIEKENTARNDEIEQKASNRELGSEFLRQCVFYLGLYPAALG
jgi:hypothetical protein